MDEAVVFYSWQRDLPAKTNRTLIQDALEGAAKDLKASGALSIVPVIDRDTQGVPGSPDIGQVIFGKIASAAAFVCDVSFINRPAEGERLTPNPNVLIELGFALRALGWERVVMVFNLSTGRVEDLPFDLRLKRTLTYRSDEADTERATARTALRAQLVAALDEILRHGAVPAPQQSPAEKAIAAVRVDARDAAAVVGDFMADLLARIASAKPKPQEGRLDDELLFEAIQGTSALPLDLTRVAEEIARRNDRGAALTMLHGFEGIRQQYDRPPRAAGIIRAVDVDLARFLGHELFVSFVSVLVKHQRWELVGEVLNEPLLVDTDEGPRTRTYATLSAHVGSLPIYFRRRDKNFISPSAELLKGRHADNGALAEPTPWRLFMDTDYLLFLRSAFDLPADTFAYVTQGWRPWTYPYLAEVGVPEWLVRAESRQFLARLCVAFGGITADEFRTRYATHANGAKGIFEQSLGFPLPLPEAAKLGSRP